LKRPANNDLIPLTDHIFANEAGVRWLAALKARADPLENKRCILGPAWLCPFALKGQGWPCQKRDKNNLDLCADIYQITYTCKTEMASGQLRLFENNWRQVCRHHQTGAILDDPKPSHVLHVCQARCAAFIKWFENDQGWNPPNWKILPCTGDTAERMEWAWHMQAHHPRLKACIFDEF
jgi:hypothetical protein